MYRRRSFQQTLEDCARIVHVLAWFVVWQLTIANSLLAQDRRWQFAGWFGGGCYPNIVFDPHVPSRLYLASDVAGIWTSDDTGETWQFATQGLGNSFVTEIEVSTVEKNLVYAATKEGIFVSRNGAKSWQKANTADGKLVFDRPDNYRTLALSKKNSGGICAATKNGEVYCSTNFGQQWEKAFSLDPSSPISALQWNEDNNFLLAASDKGIFRYDFTGKSLSRVGSKSLTHVTDLMTYKNGFAAAADGALWIGDATGRVWNSKGGRAAGSVFRVEPDDASGTIYATWIDGWRGGITLTRDDGENWMRAGQNFDADIKSDPTRSWAKPSGKSNALKLSPHDPHLMFLTDWWGVWKSVDQGKTWKEKIHGAPNIVGSDIGFAPNGSMFVATMDDGLLRSEDQGETYKPVFPSHTYAPDVSGHVWRVAFAESGRVIATSSPWDTDINQVLISDNNGRSFRQITRGLPAARPKVNTIWNEGYARALAIAPTNQSTIYMGIDGADGGGLYVSKDAGETWAISVGQPQSKAVYNALAVDPRDDQIVYWGTVDRGIFRSEDGGKTWKALAATGSIFDIKIASDGVIVAVGAQQGKASIFISSDAGASWTAKRLSKSDAADGLAISPKNPVLVAVSTVSWTSQMPQSIFLSQDGGKTWNDITQDLPPGPGAAALTFSLDGSELYVLRHGGGIYKFPVGTFGRS